MLLERRCEGRSLLGQFQLLGSGSLLAIGGNAESSADENHPRDDPKRQGNPKMFAVFAHSGIVIWLGAKDSA
jgi:hypothetical protein